MAAAVGAGAKPWIKIAAICGSLLEDSCTRGLIRSAIEISKSSIPGVEIEHVEIAELPMLNTDLEGEGNFPPVVEAFRQKILAADSILFASPEYKYSVSAPLKNALDWASRTPNVWGDKAAAIISAFGGSGGARSQYHLRQIGVFLDLHFINKPEFFLKALEPPAKFDKNGNLIDAQSRGESEASSSVLAGFYFETPRKIVAQVMCDSFLMLFQLLSENARLLK